MDQFKVIKQVTLIMGRMLQESVNEAMGADIRLLYAWEDGARAKNGSISLVHYGLEPGFGCPDREYEFTKAGEQFRSPPLILRAFYLVSAWAQPPEDQGLLGAALRTFHDRPYLEPTMEEERLVTYAERVPIDLVPLKVEEHLRLTEAYRMPMAPSVAYRVGIRLQSGRTTPIKRVKERIVDFRNVNG